MTLDHIKPELGQLFLPYLLEALQIAEQKKPLPFPNNKS